MDFFSNSKPNLLSSRVNKNINKIVKVDIPINKTVSEIISDNISFLYKNYLLQNKFTSIVIFFFILFLIYRFCNKNNQIHENYNHNLYSNNSQPTINPLYPVSSHENHVNYPPKSIPINLPIDGNFNLVNKKNIYKNPPPFTNLNSPNYNYNSVYENPSLSYYSGLEDTYTKQYMNNDDLIEHPHGFDTNFNYTTSKFINDATRYNNNNVMEYQNILNNNYDDLNANIQNI